MVALALVCAATGCDSEPEATPITDRLELRDDIRELWTAQVTWTRVYPDGAHRRTARHAGRDRASAPQPGRPRQRVRPFYGDVAADELTRLLREHIVGATGVVDAAEAGDAAALDGAVAAWLANADEIAALLAGANPHWAYEDLVRGEIR